MRGSAGRSAPQLQPLGFGLHCRGTCRPNPAHRSPLARPKAGKSSEEQLVLFLHTSPERGCSVPVSSRARVPARPSVGSSNFISSEPSPTTRALAAVRSGWLLPSNRAALTMLLQPVPHKGRPGPPPVLRPAGQALGPVLLPGLPPAMPRKAPAPRPARVDTGSGSCSSGSA